MSKTIGLSGLMLRALTLWPSQAWVLLSLVTWSSFGQGDVGSRTWTLLHGMCSPTKPWLLPNFIWMQLRHKALSDMASVKGVNISWVLKSRNLFSVSCAGLGWIEILSIVQFLLHILLAPPQYMTRRLLCNLCVTHVSTSFPCCSDFCRKQFTVTKSTLPSYSWYTEKGSRTSLLKASLNQAPVVLVHNGWGWCEL